MTNIDVSSKIQVFLDKSDDFVCEVLFILNKDTEKVIRFADIDGSDQELLKKDFLKHLKETIVDNTELRITEISKFEERKNVLFKYDYDELPESFSIFNTFQSQHEFDTFSFSIDNLDEISGIVFILQVDDLTLISYKTNYPINLYKRDSKAMGLWKSEERLVQIPEDILKVYPDFDFFYLNNDLFVRNTRVLERNFSFHKIINKKANEALELIKLADLIDDTTTLSSRLTDITFSRKLAQLGTHSIVLNNLNMFSITSFIDNYEPLKDAFIFNEDRTKFTLNTKKSQDLFLKLLNDDYLVSLLTNVYYDSANKDLVGAQ
ncbi:anti-phage protein KwaB [Sporosarcina sp. SAFN-010]|uniref:anti-phage protein KwaB n=1 Tax=Sporosarcina sp. SAFN-010 TaxID=3387273 RepID=UPI003F7FC868